MRSKTIRQKVAKKYFLYITEEKKKKKRKRKKYIYKQGWKLKKHKTSTTG